MPTAISHLKEKLIEMVKKMYNNNFSSLRIAAAFMVMGGHMGILTLNAPPVFLGKAVHSLGVYIFFLIGGYLITQSWLSDPHPLRYAVKRFFRIWPPLIVFLLVTTFLVGPFLSRLALPEYFSHPYTWKYLKNGLLNIQYSLPGVFENNPYPYAINGSLWTLPVEGVMYVLVPVLLRIFNIKKGERKSVLWVGVAVITLFVCFTDLVLQAYYPAARWVFYSTDWIQALHIVPYYFIGMVYAAPCMKKILNLPFACILLFIFSCFKFSDLHTTFILYLLFPYFVFSVAFAPANVVSKFFDKHEISYGLYLYGFFVQQIAIMLASQFSFNLSPTQYTIVCIIITAIIASGVRRFVEIPFAQLTKTILNRIPTS